MERSGNGILSLAVLVALLAGGGGMMLSPGSHADPAKPAMSGAKSPDTTAQHGKHNNAQSVVQEPEFNGFNEQARDLDETMREATTSKLSDDDVRQLDQVLRGVGTPKNPGFMIAVVPDPVRTHLSLVFDRYVDAIQQAVQDSNFEFDRAVLPWDPKEHPESENFLLRNAEEEFTKDQEKIPGILIFRNARGHEAASCSDSVPDPLQSNCSELNHPIRRQVDTLMIFLVGSSPTAGIDRTQFEVALQLAQHIGGQDSSPEHPLTIVGPTFSGSLYSLSELLQNSAGYFSPIMIASAVGSDESVANFQAAMVNAGLENKVNFASFEESSAALKNALLAYGCEQWRIWPRDVAFISETETAYGRQDRGAKDVCQRFNLTPSQSTPLSLSFPRGIFHVRSAYEQQFSDGGMDGDARPKVRTNLRPNLEEKRSAVDSVPNFSPQSVVSQDAVLMGVVDQLHRRHSQLVMVMASDPLDTLFLVRYLRKNYAYGRLVLVGPDLLLRHEAADPAMRGIMTLSSYSLRPGSGSDVVHEGSLRAADMMLPDDGTISVYNAAKVLTACLLDPKEMQWCRRSLRANPADVPIPWDVRLVDYGPSKFDATDDTGRRQCCRPDIHLDALGGDGFWPVASLPPVGGWLPQQEQDSRAICSRPEASSNHLSATWKAMYVGLLVGLTFMMICFWRASILSTFEAEVLLAPSGCGINSESDGENQSQRKGRGFLGLTRASLISLLCVASCLILAIAGWPLLSLRYGRSPEWYVLWFVTLSTYGLLSFIVWRKFRIWSFHIATAAALLCGAILSRTPQYPSFLYRYVHIDSQISPLVPLVMVSLSLAWWVWYGISGSVLSDLRRPRLPAATQDLPAMMKAIGEEQQQRLEQVMVTLYPDSRIWIPVIVVVVGLLLLTVPHWPLQSMEHYSYDRLLVGLLIVSFLLLLESALRILAVWTDARRLLRALEGQPFRYMISRIGGFSWTSIWKIGAGSLSTAHSLITRELEALQVLHAQLKMSTTATKQQREDIFPQDQLALVWTIYNGLLSGENPLEAPTGITGSTRAPDVPANIEVSESSLLFQFSKLQTMLAGTAAKLLDLLQSINSARPELKCELEVESLKKLREQPPATAKEIAEFFVSMVFINYIITILLRIRTLAAAVVGVFVFDVLALNMYPFEPRAGLRTLMFVVFATLTVCFTVVYAQMHRDPTLSRITDTKPGELGGDFWMRMLSVTGLPLVSLLAGEFPAVGNFLFSWIEPAMKALR